MGRDGSTKRAHIRVLIAEATRMGGQLVATALKRCRNHFDVIATTQNLSEAVQAVEQHFPDIAVISADLQDAPLAGFELLHRLRTSRSKTAAIVLVNSSDRDLVINAFRYGARGVFCRANSFKALPKCIRTVHNGQIWASNHELEFLLEAIVYSRPLELSKIHSMSVLTPREEEVVRLVAEGMKNREISLKLNVSEHTIRNYLFRVFDKLGVSNRVELVLYALTGADEDVA